jgi:diguanylate cyclase (GGDEF)-like protein
MSAKINITYNNNLSYNPELIIQDYIIKVFYTLAFLFTFPTALNAYNKSNDQILFFSLAAIAFFSLVNLFLWWKKKITYRTASNFLLFPLLLLMIYLVISGGINDTGPLWIFAMPATTLFLKGLRDGGIILSLFSIILITLLFGSDYLHISIANYSFDFRLRIVLVFLLVSMLTFAYAYSNQKLFSDMSTLTQKLSMMAEEDQLTKLQNRRGIQYQLEKLYEESKRTGKNFSIILCDIDFFKDINDRHGHQIGDQVLIEIAQIIKETIRRSDMAARWGGEEFLIVLPGASQREAYRVAEKIRQNVLKFLFYHQGQEVKVSLSSGVAQIKDAASIDDLIRQADDYMYQAKAKGRNITMPFFIAGI